MYFDKYGPNKGVKRLKINLHTHTTISDGKKTPEEAAEIYASQGYDAISFTDHRVFDEERIINGLLILSGCEFNTGTKYADDNVVHMLGIGMKKMPKLPDDKTPQQMIDAIHEVGGVAIWAHPAWSLNSAEYISEFKDYDAMEIYNTVSDVHDSSRPYSGVIMDMLGVMGILPRVTAADDSHFYDGEECVSYIMLECEKCDREHILEAFRAGKYYATQGPEVHIRIEDGYAVVDCSPCDKIAFFSNSTYQPERIFRNKDMTHAKYTLHQRETFVRAEVTDKNGKTAWTHMLKIKPEDIIL